MLIVVKDGDIEPFAQPPAEFAGKLGPYRSPLKFADGSVAKTPADWAKRREEIHKTWTKRLGAWPPLVRNGRVFAQEAVVHAVFGVVLGLLLPRRAENS